MRQLYMTQVNLMKLFCNNLKYLLLSTSRERLYFLNALQVNIGKYTIIFFNFTGH
jgi:hypothetical protein